jgi:hypothetical protein
MEKITYDQLPPIARRLADVLNRIVENESNLGHAEDCRTGTEPAFSRDVERCPFCADLKTADDLLDEIEWPAAPGQQLT